MKKQTFITLSILLCILIGCNKHQHLTNVKYPNYDSLIRVAYDSGYMRCGVAHITKEGIFQCDYHDNFYPDEIYDSTIRKWFIKIHNGDSLFYYRTDTVYAYVWNGRAKNEGYGYTLDFGGGASETLPNKYNGSDTLLIKEQLWRPKNNQ